MSYRKPLCLRYLANVVKLLFVKNQILFPLNIGGNIRTYNILRYLAKWHKLTYLCNDISSDADDIDKMRQMGMRVEMIPWRNPTPAQWQFYRDLAWNTLSTLPFNVAKVTNPKLISRANELLAKESYAAVICDFVQMAKVVSDLQRGPSILFQHNVEAQVFERQAKTSPTWLRRQAMALQWRKMLRFEKEAGRQFTAVIAVSDQDRETFKRDYGWEHVEGIDTAVDVEFFSPPRQADERHHLVTFVASMDWLPNQDGAVYFVKEIWPHIQREHSDSIFQIVGRNPSRRVERLAQVGGVSVLGTVPDVRPYLSDAQVVVVPLLSGGGTRIKIFEAMAMGKAVVSTSLGAEGLKVKDQQHLLIADTPRDFAKAVTRLLSDPQERLRIGQEARRLVCQNFSAEAVARQFERICLKVTQTSAVT